MFIASDRLKRCITGLEICTLAKMQISLLQARTYIVCNVCETWNWYGLGRVQRQGIRRRYEKVLRVLIEPGGLVLKPCSGA